MAMSTTARTNAFGSSMTSRSWTSGRSAMATGSSSPSDDHVHQGREMPNFEFKALYRVCDGSMALTTGLNHVATLTTDMD
ncbi:MAG: hypothetical protein M3R01_08220, partial [Actinomycetota bacterium]|nr:hypothetical protein [Actinomycetota bacterium]